MRPRDNQRSLCYRWEHSCHPQHHTQVWKTVEEVQQWINPIWRAERGRYGKAKHRPPEIVPSSWGQRSALAHGDHRISLPRWARNPWIVLHEMTHRLTKRTDESHGPRFVGILIGLAARHLGHDADILMAKADAIGLKYHVRSIGAVPVIGISDRLKRLIAEQGPLPEMWAAAELDVSYLQIRGAMLQLIRRGEARWFRKRITLVGDRNA